jgi:hypothetical protein
VQARFEKIVVAIMTAKSRKKPVDKYAMDAGSWIMAANVTYDGAMRLFDSIDPLLCIPAAYLGHHALEMLLKAGLIKVGYTVAEGKFEDGYAWGHNLVSLAQALASKYGNAFPIDEAEKELPVFDAYFEEVRYPTERKNAEILERQKGALLTKWMDNLKPFARLAIRGEVAQ